MATAAFWTREFLGDLILALRTSLDRVKARELGQETLAAQHWRTVHEWLSIADQIERQPDFEAALTRLPPFPLTGAQLRALQAAVDGAVQVRLASQPARQSAAVERISRAALARPPIPWRARVHHMLNHVQLSSLAVALLLVVIVAFNALDFFVLHVGSNRTLVAVNGALATVALVVSVVHHYHLLDHLHGFHSDHPHIAGRHLGLLHWYSFHHRDHPDE